MKKVFSILTIQEKIKTFYLFFMMWISAGLEVLSIGLVIPFIGILIDSESFLNFASKYYFLDFLKNFEFINLIIFGLVVLIITFLVKNLYLSYFIWWQQKYINNLQVSLSYRLYSNYLFKPYEFFLKKNSSELIRNVRDEVNRFCRTTLYMITLISESIVLICITFMVLFIDIINGIAISLLFFSSVYLYNNSLKKYFLDWGNKRLFHSNLTLKNLMQGFGSIKQLKLSGVENNFLQKFSFHQKKLAKVNMFSNVFSDLPRLWLEFLTILALVILILSIIYRGLPVSTVLPILAFFSAAAFRMLPSVKRILGAVQKLKFSAPSTDLVYNELKNEDKSKIQKLENEKIQFNDKLKVKNLAFKFPDSNKYIFRNLNFEVKKGQSIGFFGETGSGKSTLIDNLTGILKPSEGSIFFDDKNIQNHLKSWQNKIGYVPQDVYLNDDTIANNIAFGLNENQIDIKKINVSLKSAQLEDFVNQLPKGINTVIGERGIRLSGGQKQRIGIARALYDDPEIIFFDEATSALDNETEKKIMITINRLKKKRTLIIISHRISTLEGCDKKFEVKNAEIKENSIKI